MVQGKSKGLQQKAASSRHASKAAAAPKKGRRAIPPKKASAVKHAAIHQDLSAKINRSIEKQMVSAASSGKLTILKNEPLQHGSKAKPKGSKS
ncbi:hypothetical protein BD410DRAFT_839050 [Rickenella mellea]|uniref:Uncharacterized protein n=1 Tax=Rickenella mellea TaxID=50990 RepID=A0A4Y7Q6R9_9AGAM|nr:hypothetical protein BD410DRAFT_839050 [Rickenella mellea]